MNKVLPNYIAHLKKMEGFRPDYYKPVGEKKGVGLTIGYGHVGYVSNPPITEERASAILAEDVRMCAKSLELLQSSGNFPNLTDSQFTALVDFIFNLGYGNFMRSTLRKKIVDGASASEIQTEFRKWCYSGGKRLKGLVSRCSWRANLWVK